MLPALLALLACRPTPPPVVAAAAASPAPAPVVRFAAYNVSLFGGRAGEVVARLQGEPADPQLAKLVSVLAEVRPDVVLLSEVDHGDDGLADLLRGHLEAAGLSYPHHVREPVNTGVLTGLDLDGDGRSDHEEGNGRAADSHGWGAYPGQYGMLLLSRFPVGEVRTFQRQLWSDMPDHRMPPEHYPEGADALLRLSSKSHWDVQAEVAPGCTVHVLASHPTPPVFDGAEDRNGRRNHDEIRFWTDYISGLEWMTDDAGQAGGLSPEAAFVVMGDLNSDPADGDGIRSAIVDLLSHARVVDPSPASEGAKEAAQAGGANESHEGDPALDTANFHSDFTGNLRIDYVLPSAGQRLEASGVFWPLTGLPGEAWIDASDHRLVWVDATVCPSP